MENAEQLQPPQDDRIPGRNGGTLRPFRPGQSGNPNGLKKGTKHLSTILRKLLEQEITVTMNGQTFQLTRAEALMLEKVRLATTSPFDAVRLRAIMDIEDRIDGKAAAAQDEPEQNDNVVVFYIPNQNNRKRRSTEDLEEPDVSFLDE